MVIKSEVNRTYLVKTLAQVVRPENMLTTPRDLLAYSYDATGKSILPDVVVFPGSTGEVSAVMKIAHRQRVPVVARGSGTNLSGGTIPSYGGIVLELSHLNHILEIDTARHRVIVEPGVVNLDLQNVLRPFGFMYAPDPASQKAATLGGNLGEDAGGPHCLKYGVTHNHIRSVEMVLADGSVVEIGTPTDEGYGYDLLGPLVGSEGTLGVVTRMTLNIMRLPEAFKTMLASFATMESGAQTVSDIIAAGLVPGALELMDKTLIRAVEASFHAGYPTDAEALLLIELDGLKEGLERQAELVAGKCRANNAGEVRIAGSAAERELLWAGRRGAFGAIARLGNAYSCYDATVPRNKLVPMLGEVNRIADKYRLLIANVSHAGDGNFHPLIIFDNRNPEECQRVEKAGKEILAACVPLGGTLSGEHGIGLEKCESMPLIFSPGELRLMKQVKDVFDPEGILNPGKIFPPETPVPAESGESPRKSQALRDELVNIVGRDNLLSEPKELAAYEIEGNPPSLVVFPSSTGRVCQVLKAASLAGVPVIPWGNGTKQAKGLPLAKTGIILSLKHLNHILELDAPNLTVKVEAGINHAELQSELARHGLCFPLEPADMESATIGGSLATNSSGPGRLAYGTARDLVLGVTAVTPDGEVFHAGGKTVKNVAGYDMRKLFLGSWGTLGIITEAILRLSYPPEEHQTLLLPSSNIEDVLQIVRSILNSTLRPESMELIDANAMHAPGGDAGFGRWEKEFLLLVGVAGSREAVQRHLLEIRALAETNKIRDVRVVGGAEEANIWTSQRRIQLHQTPGMISGKAVVPINQIGPLFHEVQTVTSRHHLQVGITGHAGSGVLYVNLSPGKHDTQDDEVLATIAELVQCANQLGGFFLVESGPPEIRQAYDPVCRRSDYELMRRLKHSFDPGNILNPGKLVRSL